ncbi:MAG TPA: NADH-quinone oxidoreductase subunit J, partial [Tepidisphaeraceae bacterium]|nr:NADH-quinone oxidoreductase subunit J [Tepidisphaeraceae bacterium]
EAITTLLRRGLAAEGATADEDAVAHLADRAGGDGRAVLTALEVAVALAAGALLLWVLVVAVLNWTRAHPSPAADGHAVPYPVATLGQALLGDYLVPFELASVLLLAVMIGSAYLAKGRRDRHGGSGAPADRPAAPAAGEWR